jgi:hypothetical protein
MSGMVCSAYRWPVDASQQFSSAALSSLRSAFESVDPVSNPVLPEGHDALITIRARDFKIEVNQNTQFLTNIMSAEAEVDIEAYAENSGGRFFGTAISEDETANAEGVMGCQGGGRAVAGATQEVLSEVLQRIVQEMANNPAFHD